MLWNLDLLAEIAGLKLHTVIGKSQSYSIWCLATSAKLSLSNSSCILLFLGFNILLFKKTKWYWRFHKPNLQIVSNSFRSYYFTKQTVILYCSHFLNAAWPRTAQGLQCVCFFQLPLFTNGFHWLEEVFAKSWDAHSELFEGARSTTRLGMTYQETLSNKTLKNNNKSDCRFDLVSFHLQVVKLFL